jgi:phosphoribosylformylglycinamidine cyclo-ligase
MYRTFNMGTGFMVIVPKEEKEKALELLNKYYHSYVIGKIIGEGIIKAHIKGLDKSFTL